MEDYRIGDLVWVKMKHYPWWPSIIGTPKEGIKRPCSNDHMYFVYFFGGSSYKWTSTKFIEPFEKHRVLHSSCNLASFKIALKEAIEYEQCPMKSKYFKAKDYQMKAQSYTPRKRSIAASSVLKARIPKRKESESKMWTKKNKSFERTPRLLPSQLNLKVGFIGLGSIGTHIAKTLVYNGFKVTVWNRSDKKLSAFQDDGVYVANTPADVVAFCDVTFSCVADSAAAKEIVFGDFGVLHAIGKNKGYVEITLLDPETSRQIAEAISNKGGEYLEAPVFGSEELSRKGQLIVFVAGSSELFNRCSECFTTIADTVFFMGEVGNASKMHLILSMFMNVSVASLIETVSLVKQMNIPESTFLDILKSEPLNCPLFTYNAKAILNESAAANLPLEHMQKDLQMTLEVGFKQQQLELPTAMAAVEVYRRTMNQASDGHDVSELCEVSCNT